MKYLVIICMLFASCSIFKKSVNTHKSEVSKYQLKVTDSSGSLRVEEVKKTYLTQWGTISIDSGYDNVTYEFIKAYGDSIIIERTIKEKGQKKTEQISHISKRDTTASMITEHSQLQELQAEDSTAVTEIKQKDIDRTTFLPWWLWLIAAGVLALGWWKRNSILELFT